MDVLLLLLRLALAGLLYAFLGVVLLMLWRDLRKTTRERSAVRARGRLVIVEAASDQEDEPSDGTSFPLQPVTSIGRSPTNTVVLADTYASSHHALLARRESRWWLEDRDSRNGTMLNGEPVQEPTIVSSGDVITIGETTLRLEIDEA
jgi:pSer/pThr/pTyr-binding forkhead associated (FHA) protein